MHRYQEFIKTCVDINMQVQLYTYNSTLLILMLGSQALDCPDALERCSAVPWLQLYRNLQCDVLN